MAGASVIDQEKLSQGINFPMDSRTALTLLSKYLSDFEKQEILEYPTIYFLDV
jgi:hypothetical protein